VANPLFYSKVVPLNTQAHRELRLVALDQPFGYAVHANLMPALLEEFSAAAPFMPVAFLPGAQIPAPVFVTGLKPGQNLFVGADGKWTGGYLPAYLRRYPFIMGDVPKGDPILCIDEPFEGFSTKEGERLFSPTGEAQAVVNNALTLAETYRVSAKRAEEFASTLQRLNLFRSVTLDAKAPGGASTVVHGLLVVDENAFDALSDNDLLELHRKQFLRPIFAHLHSLGAVAKLGDMLRATEEETAA
jgi:hypothetical protein